MRLHGKIAEHQRADHGKGVGKDRGRVERGKLQKIHDKLRKQELRQQRHLVIPRDGKKVQPLFRAGRVLDEQIPNRRDKKREHKDHVAQNAQVRSHKGWEIKVICLLHKVKKVRGQEHRRRRVIDKNDDVSLHDARRCGVRPLGVAHLGKRIPPLRLHHGFRHALL